MSDTRTGDGAKTLQVFASELQRFAGEWVVLDQDTVIEHGSDLVDVADRARTRGILCPRVLYVELHREGELKLGL